MNPLQLNKCKKKIIFGSKITLKILAVDDASEEYCSWLNNPEVNKYLETKDTTIPELRSYIQKRINDPRTFFWGIFLKENNQHIGNIKLEPIDYEKKSSEFGIMIGNKNEWGRGYGTEATRLVIDFAFKELNLNRVELGVVADNAGAIKSYQKVGFKIDRVEEKKQEGVVKRVYKMSIPKGE